MEKRIYKTAMYLRLSKGDGDVDGNIKSESNSITNQRMIIQSYIDRHDDLELVGTYIDDGYTGLNYEREQFRQMMADAEAGKIDCICTKDNRRILMGLVYPVRFGGFYRAGIITWNGKEGNPLNECTLCRSG